MRATAIDTLVPYPDSGEDAVVYSLVSNTSSVKVDKNGNFSRGHVAVEIRKKVGSKPEVDATDEIITPGPTTEGLYVVCDIRGTSTISSYAISQEVNSDTIPESATSIDFRLVRSTLENSTDGTVIDITLQTLSISIIRDGDDGMTGDTGDDAVVFFIVASATGVSVADGVATPSSITVDVMRREGNDEAVSILSVLSNYGLVLHKQVDGGASTEISNSGTSADTIEIEIDTSWKSLNIRLLNDMSLMEYDTLTIPIVHNGEKGNPGDDAVRYFLKLSTNSIIVFNGTCSPSTVSAKAYKQVGSAAPVDITSELTNPMQSSNGLYITYGAGIEGGIFSTPTNPVVTLNPKMTKLEFSLVLRVNGVDYVVDTVSCTIRGYSQLRGPQDWESLDDGYAFQSGQAGDAYKDCVYYDGLYYSCITNHTKDTSSDSKNTYKGNPADLAAAGKYWQVADKMEMVATQVLLAQYGVIYFMQGNQLLIKDGNGDVKAGMAGTDTPLWVGDADAEKAPFHVDRSGKMTATDAEIAGSFEAHTEDGMRSIVINPETGELEIANSAAGKSTIISGDENTSLEGLYSNNGSGSMGLTNTSGAKSCSYTTDSTTDNYKKTVWRTILGVKQLTNQSCVTVVGTLNTRSIVNAASSSSKSYIDVRLRVYSQKPTGEDSDSKYRIDGVGTLLATCVSNVSTDEDDTQYNESNGKAADAVLSLNHSAVKIAGWVSVELEITSEIEGVGSSEMTWANMSATYAEQHYVSRYFANGFCLGQAANNYVAAFLNSSGLMNFVAQNANYGFKVTDSGILYRKGSNGSWANLV